MYPISLSCFSTRKLLLCLSASIFCLLYLPAIARATTGGPDDDGYIFFDSLESSCKTTFTDISSTGEVIDEFPHGFHSAVLALPFPFEFYGQRWNNLHISQEGVILFGITSPFEDSDNFSLPVPGIAGPAIFAYWDSLPYGAREVYYRTIGVEPNRQFIVQWHTLSQFGSDNGYLIFQVVFYENRNNFDFVYGDVISGDAYHDAGVSATIGIQKGSDTDRFIQYSYNDNTLLNGGVMALCFFHDVSLKYRVNVDQALLGSLITYTVQFTNSLPEPLTNITIVDEFSDNFAVDKITNSGPPIQQVNTEPYMWEVDEIPPNSNITIEIAGTIANNPALAGTTLRSAAYITGSGIVDNQPISTTVYIPNRPDLSQSSIQFPAAVGLNERFTITIALSNTSVLTAVGAKLSSPIPVNITYVAGSVTGGGIYNSDLNQFEWYGDIEPTSVLELSYTAIAPNVYTFITSTATLVETQQSAPLGLITRTAVVPKIVGGTFCADFEDGYLPPYILTEVKESTAGSGRVSVQKVAANHSNYALHLETFGYYSYYVESGSTQAVIMLLNMSELNDEMELSFWLRGYNNENGQIYRRSMNAIDIFMSDDDGRNYTRIDPYNYEDGLRKNDKIVLDLGTITQAHDLALSREFRIKLMSSNSMSYPLDRWSEEDIFVSRGVSIDDICITTQPPEIEVRSGTGLIPDGSLIANRADNTEFGPVFINGGLTEKTFTIYNEADQGNLILKEIEIEGIHPEDFEVVEQPGKITLEPGESTNFRIGFSTAITAIRQAVVRIFSNDSDEGIYNFTIQGHGVVDPDAAEDIDPTSLDQASGPLDGSKLYLPIIQR